MEVKVHWLISMVVLAIGLILLLDQVESCNEAVCASVVSKCMLTQSCKCDMKVCSCCKECSQCLGDFYTECCSCVEMCPKPNDTGGNPLSKKSHVEEIPEYVEGLFSSLTSEPVMGADWTTFTFPVDHDLTLYSPKLEKEIKYHIQSVEQEFDAIKPNILTLNCTVAYMFECMSYRKCQLRCQSMGASSYRWFHDGCCECVGRNCIKYGIDDSRCPKCPNLDNSDDLSGIDNADLDYGDDEFDDN